MQIPWFLWRNKDKTAICFYWTTSSSVHILSHKLPKENGAKPYWVTHWLYCKFFDFYFLNLYSVHLTISSTIVLDILYNWIEIAFLTVISLIGRIFWVCTIFLNLHLAQVTLYLQFTSPTDDSLYRNYRFVIRICLIVASSTALKIFNIIYYD